MKQNLFNKLWLRVGMIVAIMTTALSGTVWAEEESVTFSAEGYNNGQEIASYAGTNFTITFDKGTNSNAPKYYSSGTAIRCYGSNSFTVSSDYTITSIVLTFGSNDGSNAITTDVGTFSTNTWTGSANDVTFTIGGTSGNRRIAGVAVTYTTGGTPTVATPVISGTENFLTSTEVSISCATEGATIQYSTDGTTWTSYSAPFTLSATTTVQAKATKSGMTDSDVASKTFTKVTPMTISAARAQETGTVATTGVVTSINGKTAYIQDANAAIVVYGSSNLTCAVGDEILVVGTLSTFNGLLEITEPTITVQSSSNTVTPEVMTIAEVLASTNQGWLVKIEGATVSSISGQDVSIEQGGSSVLVRFNKTSDITFEADDEVTLTGNIGCYNGVQIANPTDIVVAENTDPVINAEATLSLAYDATSGEIAYTVDNPVTGTALTATSNASWISNINVGESSVTFDTTTNEGDEDRTATVTLTYGSITKNVTVTQGHYVAPVADYATLPFVYDGNGAMLGDETGVTTSGLSAYNSSPAIKFDDDGDYFFIKINEAPGLLTFDIKANPSNNVWSGTFKIQASTDGTSYSDVVSYSDLATTTESKTVSNLPTSARYIKFIYNKTTGNVALGNIVLAEYSTDPIIDADDVNIDSDATSGEIAYTITNPASGVTLNATTDADWVSGITVTADKVTFTTTANTGAERTATFTLTYTGATNKTVTVTQAAYVAPPTPGTEEWVEVALNELTADDVFVIVGNNGSNYAMSNDNGTTSAPAAVAVTVEGNKITSAVADNIKWNISSDATGYTFYPDGETETWLYCTNTNNGVRVGTNEDNNVFSVSTEGYLYNEATSRYIGIYNSQDWRSYTSINNNIKDQTFKFYKYVVAETPETESVTVTDAGYATYCSANALDFTGTDITAYVGTIDGTHLTFTPITQVPANTGLLLKAEGGATVDVPVIASAPALTITNCLTGVNVATTLSEDDYILNVNSGKAGFYKAGTHTSLGAHKAYIPAVVGGTVKSFAIDLDDDATGISTVETFTEEGAIYNLAGQRLQKMQKGINIVNGKKVLK